MVRTAAILLPALIVIGSPRVQAADATAADYAGRWNLWIFETGDSFQSSWLKIGTDGDRLSGELVWKWGSNGRIADVRVSGGELTFRRGRERYAARLVGDHLLGTAQMGRRTFFFRGRRAVEMCDPVGTWKVWMAQDPAQEEATLRIERKDGALVGSAVDPVGATWTLKDGSVDGRVLSAKAVPADPNEPVLAVKLEIRGDRLQGAATSRTPDGETASLELRGRRDREWGEPVALITDEGLAGWASRDPRRKLGWKIEDGVLENGEHDVDIVSGPRFRDFRMHLEYRVAENCNSGVYLRGRYELQILGNKAIQPHGNMAVYSRLSPSKNPLRDFDEWQSLDVTFVGRWVTVTLNGEVVHDGEYLDGITGGALDPWEETPGPLMLQGDHGKIYFRNIVVTPAK